jgi:hypothetical protein
MKVELKISRIKVEIADKAQLNDFPSDGEISHAIKNDIGNIDVVKSSLSVL